MSITINGTGSITGLTAGGLPDGSITADDIASGAVTAAKLSTGAPSWTSGGVLSFNSGYGSVATAYGCRAWVNFNGTGAVAIRASGNVSSITDNTTGSYSVNYSTAMPDANYTTVCSGRYDTNNSFANSTFVELGNVAQTTSSTRIFVRATSDGVTAYDNEQVSVAVFR